MCTKSSTGPAFLSAVSLQGLEIGLLGAVVDTERQEVLPAVGRTRKGPLAL